MARNTTFASVSILTTCTEIPSELCSPETHPVTSRWDSENGENSFEFSGECSEQNGTDSPPLLLLRDDAPNGSSTSSMIKSILVATCWIFFLLQGKVV